MLHFVLYKEGLGKHTVPLEDTPTQQLEIVQQWVIAQVIILGPLVRHNTIKHLQGRNSWQCTGDA